METFDKSLNILDKKKAQATEDFERKLSIIDSEADLRLKQHEYGNVYKF